MFSLYTDNLYMANITCILLWIGINNLTDLEYLAANKYTCGCENSTKIDNSSSLEQSLSS